MRQRTPQAHMRCKMGRKIGTLARFGRGETLVLAGTPKISKEKSGRNEFRPNNCLMVNSGIAMASQIDKQCMSYNQYP